MTYSGECHNVVCCGQSKITCQGQNTLAYFAAPFVTNRKAFFLTSVIRQFHYFQVRQELTGVEHSIVYALPIIDLPETPFWDKHSSLFCNTLIEKEKSFITLTPGANVIKLFYP
jgi:hypothetical protein